MLENEREIYIPRKMFNLREANIYAIASNKIVLPNLESSKFKIKQAAREIYTILLYEKFEFKKHFLPLLYISD